MNTSKNINLLTEATQQRTLLESAGKIALELARTKSEAAEVIITKTTGFSISTRYGKMESIEFNSDGALEITVYHQQRKGSASSTDLSKEAISRTVFNALNIACYTSPDPASGPAEKTLLAFNAPNLDLFHPIELNVERGITIAAKTEQTALNYNKRIKNTEGGNFNSHFSTCVFGNSYGMLQSYNSSRHSISCSVIAESGDNMERNYAYTISRDFNDLRSPKLVGEECARRALARLNPKKISTIKAPVLFAAEIATSLFWHLVDAISGSSVYQKSTFLLNSLGKSIMPTWLSIEEYPHLRKGLASSPFDSEGVKTSDRTIIKNGVLNTWLLNSYAARKLGLKSTGHASGIHNWHVSHQKINFSYLLRTMGCGLLVTELMGDGVNIVTGDYSRGASGFWVENGEIQYPVRGVTIAGNLSEMLKNILNISDDLERRSNIQCGSLLLSEMKIAGQ